MQCEVALKLKPRIYNREMELVGVLQNASAIGYVRTHNDLFTASFALPFDDSKNALCDTHFIVDIFDGETSKGKYRILDEPETDLTTAGQFARYSCEHVIAFLLNDVIDGYLELGGTGVTTRAVIERLLSMQNVKRWTLGTCDFDYQFQYSWENTNLLDALFSIPTCFVDDYHWTYNTDSYPWTLNLVRQNKDRTCEIRRKRNMQYIKREKDSSALCTRLYCKGSGEGVNQLNIKEVNGGLPYIDADTIEMYGTICGHYIDLTLTDAETLLAKGRAVLEEVKHPRYTYKAKAVDLCKVTGLDWHTFDEGKFVHIIDEEKKIDLDAMIIEVSKPDVDGDPLDVDLTISNKPSDASSAIEDLSRRAAITAQYSQGATNLYSQQYSDNADTEHPATMRFFVPRECAKINKVLLSWQIDAFRSYETGDAAGGGIATTTSAGGESTNTSSSGGGSTRTTSSGGATTVTTETQVYAGAVSISGPVDMYGDSMIMTGEATNNFVQTGAASGRTGASTDISTTESGTLETNTNGSHSHTFAGSDTIANGHTHSIYSPGESTNTGGVSNNATHYVNIAGTTDAGGAHIHYVESHRHTVPAHSHTLNSHTHSLAIHQHAMDHVHAVSVGVTIPALGISIPSHIHIVDIPAHEHSVTVPNHTHDLSIDDHTHEIVYGIYEGGYADGVDLVVDGTTIPPEALEENEIDIVAYLDKDNNGKITRGTWHEIKIVPNGLTRIEANLFVQTFVTSYSGGNY